MEKREENPCYKLFFFPERDHLMRDFLQCAIDILKKKYGAERLLKDRTIARAFRLLQEINDNEVRVFALMILITWEPNISEALQSGIDDTHPIYNRMHFTKFMARLHQFVEQTIHFPYNKHNIIEIVTEFEKAARLEYMMGPLTTKFKSSS